MIRKLVKFLLMAALLLAFAGGGAGWWLWQWIHEPFQGHGGDVALLIEPGTSATEILRRLESSGVIRNAEIARLFLIHRLQDPSLKAGEYKFSEALGTPEALDKLVRGEVVTHALTLIEGLTLDETAQAIADAGFGDWETLKKEVRRTERIADLDPAADNLEGYLYPETYHFARGTTEREIVDTLVGTFRRRYESEVRPLLDASPEMKGLSGLRDLVTLASIVEKETQLEDERAVVASVYRNRLRIGMGLYADPTLIYGKKIAGTWDGNLRRVDLKTDSPYNTYMRPGLPPSPICSPSIASLIASIHPAETAFLYFVSRNDGTHVFAETKAEHDRNVYKWQKLYWRKRWAEERAAKSAGS